MFQQEVATSRSERGDVTDLAVAPDLPTEPPTGVSAAPRPLPAETARPRPHRSASFARVVGADCTDRAWPLDGAGVEQVAARLARLGDRWSIVHGVPVHPTDVADLLVVGPGGVYAVTVRHAPGASVWTRGETVLVNGAPTRWVAESRRVARGAGARLAAATECGVEVTALLVVVGAHDGFVCHAQPRDGVRVLTRRDVDGWLRTQPARLVTDEVETLYTAARLPHTWAA